MTKEKTKTIMQWGVIGTLDASENELRLSRFHRHWKALGELANRTSNSCDLEDFTYAHTPELTCRSYRAQKRTSGNSKMALKIGKNVIFCNYNSKFDRPAHPYGHQILVAPPMEGCNRVLGSH